MQLYFEHYRLDHCWRFSQKCFWSRSRNDSSAGTALPHTKRKYIEVSVGCMFKWLGVRRCWRHLGQYAYI